MKFTKRPAIISIAPLVLVATLALTFVNRAESASVGDYMSGAKNYLVSVVRNGLLSKSAVVTSFGDAMTNIKKQFEQAKLSGKLDGKDEAETSAFYYKLVIEEIRRLKKKIADEKPAQQEAQSAQDKFLSSCNTCAKSVAKKHRGPQFDMMDMEMDLDDEDDEELELMNELDNLEDLNKRETEMGWGLSPENRAALQSRTLQVLGDLVQNELKTLAMIIVTTYIGGPAAGVMGPAVTAARFSLKSKLIEYFLQSVMDTFAGILGQKINPQMQNPLDDPAAVVASKE